MQDRTGRRGAASTMTVGVTGGGLMTTLTLGGRMLMENGDGDLLPQPEMMGVTEADTMVATVTTGTGEIATMAVTATTGTEETGAAEASPITSLLEIGAGVETVGGMEASPEGTGKEATAGEETGMRGGSHPRRGRGCSWLPEVSLSRMRTRKLVAQASLEALSLWIRSRRSRKWRKS